MKKLLLTTLMAGVALLGAAITPEDLDGKPVLQVFWGNTYQAKGPTLSMGGTFRYDASEGQLYIDRFRGRFTLPVTLSNDKIIIPLKTTFYGEDPDFRTGRLYGVTGYHYDNIYGQSLTNMNGYHATCYIIQGYTSAATSTYELRSEPVNCDLPGFILDCSHIPLSFSLELNGSTQNFATFSKMAFYVMENANAHATDANGQSYDMQVNLIDNEVISFPNLYNQGIRYRYTYAGSYPQTYNYDFNWIKGKYKRNDDNRGGVIQLEPQYTGGMYSTGYHGYTTAYSGTTNPMYLRGYWYSAQGQKMNQQRLASDLVETDDQNLFYPISGRFDVTAVYHDTPDHQWAHTADGRLHTYEDWDIEIDKSVFYNQATATVNGRYVEEFSYDWTKIKGNKIDVTHKCTIDKSSLQFGYGKIADDNPDTYIYLGGQVSQDMHLHHLDDVDYYEYYLVPGTYNKPDTEDFDHADGHVNGLNITDYITDFQPVNSDSERPAASSLNEGNNFNLLFPEKLFSSVKGVNPDPDGKYTMYVKANYKTPDLAPTFHALTPVGNPTTGVSDLVIDYSDVSVEAVSGGIAINGSNGNATVCTVSGTVVYHGGDNTIDLAPGLYIVHAGKTVKKILVK